jgi:hypothetical protein
MTHQNEEEFLTRCVVDTASRKVYMYSNLGDEKVVTCDNVNEFMNVLSFVRATVDEDVLSYSDPLVVG